MQAYALTDAGRIRAGNQDYLYASSEPVGNLPNLFLVADAMGGHRAGDYASRFTVEQLTAYARTHQGSSAVTLLQKGIEEINGRLYRQSLENPAYSGMGTTLVAAVIQDGILYAANVGDSRLYLCRNGSLRQVTRDHSFVEEMVALGQMQRNSRDYLEKKNIITRALGTQRRVRADFFEEPLLPGDRILLCSDGLSNMVPEEQMLGYLSAREPLSRIVEQLVEAANQNGGKDNIAAVVVDPEISEVKAC